MTAAWMLYAAVIGALLAGAAWAAERALGSPRGWGRWIWIGALLLTAGLTITAPVRSDLVIRGTEVVAAAEVVVGDPAAPPAADPGAGFPHLARLIALAAGTAAAALAGIAAQVPAWLNSALALGWIGTSGIALLALLWTSVRVRRSLRRWPAADVQGVRVRVAPAAGPAVVGLRPSHIVVPQWLLTLDPAEQRLILSHELEHRRAGDPLVLAAGCLAAAVLPWHPAVWAMLRWLRLAVELDCDARVLRRGVAPGAYGSLLIDLAGRCSGFPVGAPALADGTSHLERRLIVMNDRHQRPGLLGATTLGILALSLGLAACEAALPTAAEVAAMDAASAETAAREATIIPAGEGGPDYYMDGVEVDAEAARSLPADSIAQIEVFKGAEGEPSSIRITTRDD